VKRQREIAEVSLFILPEGVVAPVLRAALVDPGGQSLVQARETQLVWTFTQAWEVHVTRKAQMAVFTSPLGPFRFVSTLI